MSCTCVSFDASIQYDKRLLELAKIIKVTLIHHNETEKLKGINYLKCGLKEPNYEFNGYKVAIQNTDVHDWQILVNDTFFTKHFGFFVVKLIFFLIRLGYYDKNKVYGVVRRFNKRNHNLQYIQSFLFLYHADFSDVLLDLLNSKFKSGPILLEDPRYYLTQQEVEEKLDQKSAVIPIEVELFLDQQKLMGRILPFFGEAILILLAKIKRRIPKL